MNELLPTTNGAAWPALIIVALALAAAFTVAVTLAWGAYYRSRDRRRRASENLRRYGATANDREAA